jgi:glycosyltransferase involved in cell wall biosynthesis
MSRLLVVTHSADERDAVLWKTVIEEYPHVDLVIPDFKNDASDKQWIEPLTSEKRAFLLPAKEPFGKGHSSLWMSGLQGLLHQGNYSLLHAAMEPWSLIPQAFVKRIPTVVQGAESVIANAPWQLRLRRTGLRRVLKNLAGLSAWGQTSVDAFVQAGLPPTTPRAVIPMGIPDPKIFHRTPIPSMKAGLNVLYVGRLDPEKGVATIIDALRIISTEKNIHLRILGTGTHEQHLRTLANNVPAARIDFEGQASLADVQVAMQWSHVVIVPSLVTDRWMEQWGRVPVEAILSGRPCLVSDSGELPHISPVPGTVFTAGDPEDLWRRLENLVQTPNRMQRLANEQHAHVESLNAYPLAHALNDLWSRCTGAT